MRKLALHPDGGSERGDRTRLRNQMERLFGCSVSLIYEDERSKRFVRSHIAESGVYWWNPKRPDERMLWDSKIRLGEAFLQRDRQPSRTARYEHPQGPQAVRLGPRSLSLGGLPDLHPPSPLRLSWRQLCRQFGSEQAQAGDKFVVRNFRTQALRELKKIKMAWPDLNYATARGVLILHPSKSAVPPTPEPLRLVE